MATIQDLANYIMQMEGYNITGSLAQRNNNPGNLRWASTQTGTNAGYATFASPQDGYNALIAYIQANMNLTLGNFINKYAPPTENNTSAYTSFVANGLNLSADTPLSTLGDSTNVPTDITNISTDQSSRKWNRY